MSDIHIHLHLPPGALAPLFKLWKELNMNMLQLSEGLGNVSANLVTASESLGSAGTSLEKATNEIIVALSNAGNTTPEVDTKLQGLLALSESIKTGAATIKTAAEGLDALNEDLPAEPPQG